MVAGTMIPIPKVKRLICASDNFHAITLSSVLGKLFDLIILDKEQEAICTSDLQFGFIVTQCINVFKETVNHYNCNKSNVLYCFEMLLRHLTKLESTSFSTSSYKEMYHQ